MKTAAIVLGAGSGRRMGAAVNKVLLPLAEIPVIIRSVQALLPFADRLVLATSPGDRERMTELLEQYGLDTQTELVEGGAQRQDSVRKALYSLPRDTEWVLIHDGARPLVEKGVICAALNRAMEKGSGIAAVPVTDTIKRAGSDGRILQDMNRSELYAMQTPQAFAYPLIFQAHQLAEQDGFYGTDDASLLEHAGMEVYLSPGSRRNLKITTPEDMIYARLLLENGER